jgi:ribonucleoside-diphosphate reductase alpha chain
MTDDADIRMAQSMMDYIFRRLALDYLPFETRSAMALYTSSERARALETGEYTPDITAATETIAQSAATTTAKPVEVKIEATPVVTAIAATQYGSSTELLEAISGIKTDAPLCMTCGVKMRMSGACFVCEGCGNTSGCS